MTCATDKQLFNNIQTIIAQNKDYIDLLEKFYNIIKPTWPDDSVYIGTEVMYSCLFSLLQGKANVDLNEAQDTLPPDIIEKAQVYLPMMTSVTGYYSWIKNGAIFHVKDPSQIQDKALLDTKIDALLELPLWALMVDVSNFGLREDMNNPESQPVKYILYFRQYLHNDIRGAELEKEDQLDMICATLFLEDGSIAPQGPLQKTAGTTLGEGLQAIEESVNEISRQIRDAGQLPEELLAALPEEMRNNPEILNQLMPVASEQAMIIPTTIYKTLAYIVTHMETLTDADGHAVEAPRNPADRHTMMSEDKIKHYFL